MSELRLGTLNKVLLMGRLTREPELRATSSSKVLNIGLAVNRRYKNNLGEWKDDTAFVNVVAWNPLADRVVDRLYKGAAVLVEGRLQSRTWEQDGQKRSAVEVNAISIQTLDKMDAVTVPVQEPLPAGDEDDSLPFKLARVGRTYQGAR
jgi:single-strand DNA-binding protein